MATAIILLQFAIVLTLIFKGARVGGIGLGIYWYGGRDYFGVSLWTETR